MRTSERDEVENRLSVDDPHARLRQQQQCDTVLTTATGLLSRCVLESTRPASVLLFSRPSRPSGPLLLLRSESYDGAREGVRALVRIRHPPELQTAPDGTSLEAG